jgi:hypothetical protein
MSKDIKALIREARLPERTVQVCLHADLVAEMEQAERELSDAQHSIGDSLAAGSRVREITERIEALRQQMLDHADSPHPHALLWQVRRS